MIPIKSEPLIENDEGKFSPFERTIGNFCAIALINLRVQGMLEFVQKNAH